MYSVVVHIKSCPVIFGIIMVSYLFFFLRVIFGLVLYAHEQCLLCFGHCADIWYEGALYLQRASEGGVSAPVQGQ